MKPLSTAAESALFVMEQQRSKPVEEWAAQFFSGTRGMLVVGHGTADATGSSETLAVARLVAQMLPGVPVELGFLEVIGPSIGEALLQLAARGCREVVAAPLLLFTAGHARQDVPDALREGALAAGVVVRQAEALGCLPEIVLLARQRRSEALARLTPLASAETALVMVGRGSSDPDALRQLQAFTAATLDSTDLSQYAPRYAPLAGQFFQPGRVEIGFVTAARPTLAEALAAAAGTASSAVREKIFLAGNPFPTINRRMLDEHPKPSDPVPLRIIVQPHLLFGGHVHKQVLEAMNCCRKQHPDIEWVEVDRLGPASLVAAALLRRAGEATHTFDSCGI